MNSVALFLDTDMAGALLVGWVEFGMPVIVLETTNSMSEVMAPDGKIGWTMSYYLKACPDADSQKDA